MKHTPGPWYQRPSASSPGGALANARLIQAAPLLLAACEDVLISLVGGVRFCGWCVEPLDGASPYSQGQHRQGCPVPGVEAAVKQARTA